MHVCAGGACIGGEYLKVRGQAIRLICHMLCHLLLILYLLPHRAVQTDRQTPATLQTPLFSNMLQPFADSLFISLPSNPACSATRP